MNRSFWILMTLMTRPLAWMITVFLMPAAVIFLSGLLTHQYQTVEVDILKPPGVIRVEAGLRAAVESGDEQAVQIDWGQLAHKRFDLMRITAERMSEAARLQNLKTSHLPDVPRTRGADRHIGEQHYVAVDQHLATLAMPKTVAALDTGTWPVRQPTLDKLASITSLKRLGSLDTFSDDKLDLSPLSKLTALETLDLGMFSSESTSLAPLAQLPKLETLVIGSHRMITAERMSEVARLPFLKTLHLPEVTGNQRALNALRELAGSDSLTQIYAAITLDDKEGLAAVQTAIPNASIYASKYLPAHSYALTAVVWMSLILGGFALHFVAMFSMPIAELVPNYKSSHQRVIWMLVGLVVVGLTSLVCWFGANVMPTMAIISICLLVPIRDGFATQLSFGESRGIARLSALLPVALLGGMVLVSFTGSTLIESYLIGGDMLIPIVLLTLTCLLIVSTYHAMNRFCRDRIEKGKPIMLSMHDIQRAGVDLSNRKSESQEYHPVIGSPFDRNERLSLAFGFFALALVLFSIVTSASPWSGQLAGVVVMMCSFAPLFSVSVVGMKWWQRMPYLTGMMIRPPRRQRQIDGLFQSVARDLLCLIPIALANIILLSSAALFAPGDPLLRVGLSVLLVASFVAVCYAAIMWTLVIRSVFGMILVCVVIYIGAMLTAVATVLFGRGNDPTFMSSLQVLIAVIAMSAAALVAIVLARRHFQQLEWGRFV